MLKILKQCQPPALTKTLETKKNKFHISKATTVNSVLIQNNEILVIFQYLQTKHCNGFEIIECCFTLRR